MTSREIIARLKKEGWQLVHIRGSHHHYKHSGKPGGVTIPHPKKDLPKGTVRSIYRQAGWQWPEKK
jgi:predicted RNA binding protein YcfA (HicA-like mRNA interferase family)